MEISKDLLSEVLSSSSTCLIKVHKVIIKNHSLNYFYNSKDSSHRPFEDNKYINIYELAYKCKEWIILKGLSYTVYYDDSFKNYKCEILEENFNDGIDAIGDIFVSSNEIQAVFSACQWILENKGIK